MKRFILAWCLALIVAAPVWARPWYVVFGEGNKQFSPDKFGYKVERKDAGDSVHLTVTMSPDAAKAFQRARLWLYSKDALVLDTYLSAEGMKDGGNQFVLTVAKTHLEKSQIVIDSAGYNAPTPPNFAGFKVMLEGPQIAEPPLSPAVDNTKSPL